MQTLSNKQNANISKSLSHTHTTCTLTPLQWPCLHVSPEVRGDQRLQPTPQPVARQTHRGVTAAV